MEPRTLLVPIQRLGDPLEGPPVERLGGGDRGHAGDLGLDVWRQPREGKQLADPLARAAVARRDLAVREPVGIELSLDFQGEGEVTGDARRLGTRRRRRPGPFSAPL